MKITNFILLIDSYLVRKGLVSLLNRVQGLRVLKEFGADDPFLSYLQSHPVDYMIMGQSVFDRSHDLFITKPELLEKIVLLQDPHKEVLVPGESPYNVHTSIHLEEDKETIINKIRNLLDQRKQDDSTGQSTELSPRETTILRHISMGLTNRQIAEKLFLSAHTVMTHRKNISSKLGIKSVSGLTVYAIVNNIITIEEVSSLPTK
jgi:DNA-binding NarL/FixJ family response regulator